MPPPASGGGSGPRMRIDPSSSSSSSNGSDENGSGSAAAAVNAAPLVLSPASRRAIASALVFLLAMRCVCTHKNSVNASIHAFQPATLCLCLALTSQPRPPLNQSSIISSNPTIPTQRRLRPPLARRPAFSAHRARLGPHAAAAGVSIRGMHACMHACMHVCMYIYIYIHIYICVCMYVKWM